MSQSTQPTQPQNDEKLAEAPLVANAESSDIGSPETPATPVQDEESTIGTGTSMALGCIAGTVVLIIFGLLFLALSTLV